MLFSVLLLVEETARAQSVTDPGQLKKRVKPPTVVPKADDRLTLPVAPRLTPSDPGRQFVLTGVEIVGATVYSAEAFSPLYTPHLGRRLYARDIKKILDAITAKYRGDGYLLSRAVAKPQALEFGIVRIQVLEGYISRVSINGDVKDRSGLLQRHIGRIKAAVPINIATLERSLLLMSDLPGIQLRQSIREIEGKAGVYELILQIDVDKSQQFASVDNRGTAAVGKLQAIGVASFNSLFGRFEQTRLVGFTIPDDPQELMFFDLSHREQIGSDGLSLNLAANYSKSKTGVGSRDLGRGKGAAIDLSYPVIRRQDTSLVVNGKLELSESREEKAAGRTADNLTVLRLGGTYSFVDPMSGANRVGVELSQGLNIFGASDTEDVDLSDAGARASFSKAALNIARRQSIGKRVRLDIGLSAQKSSDSLLSAEQFSVGGTEFGRAYDPSEIVGRDGFAGSVEMVFIGSEPMWVLDSYELFGFYDFGAVWNNETSRDSIASAGIGIRFDVMTNFSGSLELAKPLTRTVAEEHDNDVRVFFSLSAIF